MKMNPINLIQNYREKYSVMNVPSNLKDEIHIFNLKRKITDEELSSILKKRTEKLREANEILKQKIKLMEIEERIKKEELAEAEWKNQTDIVKESSVEIKPKAREAECTYESCWHNTLKGKELEEAKEAYEHSEV
jgi:hypothetical protein